MADQHSDRIDRIEAALASRLGLDLAEFDGHEIQTARAEQRRLASEKAAEIVKGAFVEPELTLDQRLARIEVALRSGGSLA